MEELRQRVLDLIQSGFPLESDPYGVMAERLGATREEVLDAVAALRRDGAIRRLGASFASKKLGYSSTLCALPVPGDAVEVDRVAAIVNGYPNVTHNYLRNNRYNLWFTIIARSADEVACILSEIEERSGCAGALNLPATALYKIKVDFGAMKRAAGNRDDSRGNPSEPAGVGVDAPFDADDPFDVALVRWAQEDIAGRGDAVDPEPFATAAASIATEMGDASANEQRVLERLRSWKRQKIVRRFGALVAHRKMGYAFNGMTVWDVPAEQVDVVGKAFAAHPFVSHCYARPRSEEWPYNLYAMVHATSQEELDGCVAQLRDESGYETQVLVSTREYKKTSMRYFAEDKVNNRFL